MVTKKKAVVMYSWAQNNERRKLTLCEREFKFEINVCLCKHIIEQLIEKHYVC